MRFRSNTYGKPLQERGFSILEMLIGVAIGLIALVVIFQMLISSQARKRTTASGGDAQVAGVLGLFNLERDIRAAGLGFGMAPMEIMGCTVTASFDGTAITPAMSLFPIQIVQGTSGAPDSITTFYGNSSFLTATQTFTEATASTKKTQTRNGFKMGDKVIVAGNTTAGTASSASCALVEVTSTANTDGYTFDHGTADYTSFYTAANVTPKFNTTAGTGTTYAAGSLFNLGPNPQRNRWQIQSGRLLTSTETLRTTTANEVAEGIVNLQAQYGVDSDNDGLITDGSGTPATANEWVTAAPTDWTKVLAIRVAILARSRQYERDMVSPTARVWQGGTFTMTNLDGTAGTTAPAAAVDDWRYYRYNVYEKVIPLRNMIWGGTKP